MAGEYIEFNNTTQPAVNDTNLNRLQQLIKQDIVGTIGGDTLPVGAIVIFGSETIPENWLLCNGQAVSRTDYQDLFNTIGITFGQGDGFTTFNLPNLNQQQIYIIKAKQSSGVVATVVDGLTSTSATDALSAKQGKVLNEKIKSKLITAKVIRQNIDVPTEWAIAKIPINSNIQIGNKFTVSNNAVKIGSGITKVLVSAHCGAISFQDVAGDKQFLIYKNEDAVSDAYVGFENNVAHWATADISPFLLEVQQNDLISLRLISGQAGSVEILPGHLTVEVVEEG